MKNMTVKKLVKLLKYNDYIYVKDWSIVLDVVNTMPNCQVITKEWLDSNSYKNKSDFYKLDLTDIKTWSNYEGCRDLRFTIDDKNRLLCKARIYDGSMVDGERRNQRFYAEFLMPMKFIKKLESNILWTAKERLRCDYETYLENLRDKWVDDQFQKILNE